MPSLPSGVEPREAEEADGSFGFTVESQLTEDFPHHAGELEAVSAESACEAYQLAFWVTVDDEVTIG